LGCFVPLVWIFCNSMYGTLPNYRLSEVEYSRTFSSIAFFKPNQHRVVQTLVVCSTKREFRNSVTARKFTNMYGVRENHRQSKAQQKGANGKSSLSLIKLHSLTSLTNSLMHTSTHPLTHSQHSHNTHLFSPRLAGDRPDAGCRFSHCRRRAACAVCTRSRTCASTSSAASTLPR
jgi:hypothetical protein